MSSDFSDDRTLLSSDAPKRRHRTRRHIFVRSDDRTVLSFEGLFGIVYAADAPHYNSVNASYLTDTHATLSYVLNGIPIGPKAASDWLYVYPRGIRDLLLYTKTKYNDPLIYVTENGIDEFNDPKLTLEVSLNDTQRVDYYYRHLYCLQRAIK